MDYGIRAKLHGKFGSDTVRVLLTGNRGYIGVVLASMLEQAGHDVRGLDSDLFQSCDFGPAANAIPTIRKDVRDVDPRDLEGFEAVLHLAGISNDPLGDMNPAMDLRDQS